MSSSESDNPAKRLAFLTTVALLSICMLVAGLFPSRGTEFGNMWILAGLFGLTAALGLAESAKSEVAKHKKLLDSYLAEARTDPMLGLANRRAFDLELERLMTECRACDESLSIVLIDLDQFDDFNRQHGYHNGDEMLRAVARIVRSQTRGIGIASRVGGDQLAVIFAGEKLQAAKQLAQRLHEAIAGHMIDAPGGELTTSASIAVVECQTDESAEDVLHRLRECLYAAKEGGRNCVVCHDGAAIQHVSGAEHPDSKLLVST